MRRRAGEGVRGRMLGLKGLRVCAAALSLAAPLLLSGCGNFFMCEGKADCPSSGGGGGGTTSGDYVYVSNSSSGPNYLSGYEVSTGKLKTISGFPYSLGYSPVALAVAPSNSFLYAATLPGVANPGIYRYNIGTSGSLSGGTLMVNDAVSSMDISPDGNYLFTVTTSGQVMNEYSVNTTTGVLALAISFQLQGVTCVLAAGTSKPASQTCSVKVSPSGAFVVVALGTAGDAIFAYSSNGGITSQNYSLISTGSTTAGDYSLVLDASNYAYIARTDELVVYAIASNGAATLKSTATYASGSAPRSVVLSSGSNQVYTANEGVGTVSGYSIQSGGVLSQVTNSPFTGPAGVSALCLDNTGGYIVAAGFDSSVGVQLFAHGTTGGLILSDSAGSGTSTNYPAVLACTH